jgi:hypothetical protein
MMTSCSPHFVDASKDEPYRSMVGRLCISNLPLQAHGVTSTLEKIKKIDSVLISELRLKGPEFTFMESLPPQTSIRIVEAQKCTNCLFEDQAQYVVTVTPKVAKAEGSPIYVRHQAVATGVFLCQ